MVEGDVEDALVVEVVEEEALVAQVAELVVVGEEAGDEAASALGHGGRRGIGAAETGAAGLDAGLSWKKIFCVGYL